MGGEVRVRKNAWFCLLFSTFKPYSVLFLLLIKCFFTPFNCSIISLPSVKLLVVVVGGRTNKQKLHKKTCLVRFTTWFHIRI